MATSTIKCDYKTGTVSSYNGSTVTNLTVKQYGKVVVLNGFISASLTANTETQIATISGVSLPTENVRAVCGVANAAYQHPADTAYIIVGTSGKISVNSTQSGTKAVYFSVSYIA